MALGRWLRASRHAWLAAAVYFVLAAIYTWPLLREAGTTIASDRFDPVLNASILWWNATVLPFTTAWWTPPFFFPSENIAAFTENLVGLAPIATPVFWITRDPAMTYNLTFFATWPLSAIGAYLLAWRVIRRHDAAFIAGLAFGFAPYRITQMGHLQVLCLFWLPIALFALHGYLTDRRRRWLVLFGVMWILQSLANGYFMFFSAVVIALWIAYFCSARFNRHALLPILAAWAAASVPLAAVMLKYRAIHALYGLARPKDAAIYFGAQARMWTGVPNVNWFWSRWFTDAGSERDLFPGMTALALALIGIAIFLIKCARPAGSSNVRRILWLAFGAIAAAGMAATLVTYTIGPWRHDVAGVILRMHDIERSVPIALAAGLLFAWLTPHLRRRLGARSPFFFYAAATVTIAVLACGPEIRFRGQVLMSSAPYAWLVSIIPGFDGLRVSARFWAVGTLCLAMAGASAFAWIVPHEGRGSGAIRIAAFAIIVTGLMLDGWPRVMPLAKVPDTWAVVEPPESQAALIELPLGPNWDAAATFRSIGHRRRVVNGVSGYDPPHYGLLQQGLDERDPAVLLNLAMFGPLEVVVSSDHDPRSGLKQYVESIEGVTPLGTDGVRSRYLLPATKPPSFGATIPIQSVTASVNADRGAMALDTDVTTAWLDEPQHPDQWFRIDLGRTQTIGGIEMSLGADRDSFPRRLAVEISDDASSWRVIWEGTPIGPVIRGAALNEHDVRVQLPVAAADARFIRLRQLAMFNGRWVIAEVRVFSDR